MSTKTQSKKQASKSDASKGGIIVDVSPFAGQIGPNISRAITNVIGCAVDIAKAHDNKFEGFKYASVDDLFEALRIPMAKNGLFVSCTVAGDISEVGPHLMAPFDITLHHVSGEVYGPVRTYALAPVKKGSFAFGMMQSYAVKYFCRQIFMVKLGEDEIDALPAEPAPVRKKQTVANAEHVAADIDEKAVSSALAKAADEYLGIAADAEDDKATDALARLRMVRQKYVGELKAARAKVQNAFVDAETAFIQAVASICDAYAKDMSDKRVDDVARQIALVATAADVASNVAKRIGMGDHVDMIAGAAGEIVRVLRDAKVASPVLKKLEDVARRSASGDSNGRNSEAKEA